MYDERRKWRKCDIDDEKSMLGDLHDCYDNWKLLLTWPLADGFHDRRDVIHLSANVERKWRECDFGNEEHNDSNRNTMTATRDRHTRTTLKLTRRVSDDSYDCHDNRTETNDDDGFRMARAWIITDAVWLQTFST